MSAAARNEELAIAMVVRDLEADNDPDRGSQCERMASATADPERRLVLRHMRQMWLTLAKYGDCGNIDDEFERLIAVEAELKSSDALH
ncbi:MAG: hypothetical protein GEU95_11925 [Rhizobiales bacterium]|nr:hypothetical protein [Hyphomicrobiales bacterium]